MPVSNISDKFSKIQQNLKFQQLRIDQWQDVALLADSHTPFGTVTDEQYEDAYTRYDSVYKYLDGDTAADHTLVADSLIHACTAIEIAPPEGQRLALKRLHHHMEENMQAFLNKKNTDGKFEFQENDRPENYADYLLALTEGLHDENKALDFKWIVQNLASGINENNQRTLYTDRKLDLNYTIDYYQTDADTMAAVANDIINEMNNPEIQIGYSTEYVSWIGSLLPKSHPRHAASFRSAAGLVEVYVMPQKNSDDQILMVEDENHDDVRTLQTMMNDFRVALKAGKVSEGHIKSLAETLEQSAAKRSNAPSVQKALLDSATHLRALNIDA